ncbi:hypothetical protein DL771_002093 [Monosporascus sp. 5C6A]|nr:hypothetical protein DL771_002093 [Monosporascus sp. 5C6A]
MTKDTRLAPRNWPTTVTYLTQPVYSPVLLEGQRRALKIRSPELTTEIPSNLPRGPSPVVRIVPIAEASHPAYQQSGLFAARFIPPGSFIVPYYGIVHPSLSSNNDGQNRGHGKSDYDLWLDHEADIAVDAEKAGNEARFVNDYRGVSERPNAEFKECWDTRRGEKVMGVFALPTGRARAKKSALYQPAVRTKSARMPRIDPLLQVKADVDDISDNDVGLRQYPSHVPNDPDVTSFYHDDDGNVSRPGRQQSQEHQQAGEHPGSHDHQAQAPDEQQQQDSLHGARHQQHSARPAITSAEELQLAAQLSQDIRQGMTPAMLEPTADHAVDVGDSNLRETMPEQDNEPLGPVVQQHEESSLQQEQLGHQHSQELPSHDDQPLQPQEQHHDQPLQSTDQTMHQHEHSVPQQHDESLQHHAHQPQHQFMPNHQGLQQQPPTQAHGLPQHIHPHGPLGHLPQHYGPVINDNTPPRKRSKVSRACDECRRKKVKCDAASENGEEACSNCRRSNVRCLFSRIPQKRGPSKGYIKELADRIHSIEGKLASEGGNVDALSELLSGARRDSSDIFSPPGQPDENGRKRPFSSISTGDFGTPGGSRQATWNSEPRPIQPFQPPRQPYSAHGLAPQPLAKPDTDNPSRPAAVMDGLALDLDQNATVRELDDGAFTGYLNVVHQCYPLLAASKDRVEDRLLQCPPLLRDAFVEALYGTMQSFVSVPGLYTNGDISSASRLITEWESDPSPRTPVMNLVHLQTLALMAIATDNYGPPSLKGEHGGASKPSVLGRAVGLAYSMRLHIPRKDIDSDAEFDVDSDENVATRAWWTLVMLDRWNAISTSSPLFIPNDSVVIVPSLELLLGDGVYHLARLSNILGHFAPVSLAPPQTLTPASGAAPLLSSFFNLSIELFREVLPSTIEPATYPILHLVYWHSRLLAYLFQTNSKSADILWPCKESVALLLANAQVLSPLNHHFFCLTTLSLLELAKVDATREEANGLLKELLDSNHAPSTWDGVIRDRITERLRPATLQAESTEAMASQGLQHLADLAAATKAKSAKPDKDPEASSLRTSDNYEDAGFDPRTLTRGGYLNVLVEPRPTTVR